MILVIEKPLKASRTPLATVATFFTAGAMFENADLTFVTMPENADLTFVTTSENADLTFVAMSENADLNFVAMSENADLTFVAMFENADLTFVAMFENADLTAVAVFFTAETVFENADLVTWIVGESFDNTGKAFLNMFPIFPKKLVFFFSDTACCEALATPSNLSAALCFVF